MNRIQFRAAQRERSKKRMKELQKLMGIPKCFVQHARAHGKTVHDIATEYRKMGYTV
jgi:hypothetical protein